jgi:hypothetical protein
VWSGDRRFGMLAAKVASEGVGCLFVANRKEAVTKRPDDTSNRIESNRSIEGRPEETQGLGTVDLAPEGSHVDD